LPKSDTKTCPKEKVSQGKYGCIFLDMISFQSDGLFNTASRLGQPSSDRRFGFFFGWCLRKMPVCSSSSNGTAIMKKSILLASLLAAIALTACGKKEEMPVAPAAPAAEPAAPAAAPAAAEPAAATTDAAATPTMAGAVEAAKDGAAAAGAAATDAAADAAKMAADKAAEAAKSAVDAAKGAVKPAQ
jgi:hypothetical protein